MKRLQNKSTPLALSMAGASLFLFACSSGGGGNSSGPTRSVVESEPNDAVNQADNLKPGVPGVGSLATAGDVDYWGMNLTAGTFYSIDLHAYGVNRDEWRMANNQPSLVVLDADGTTTLIEHDLATFGFGTIDVGIPVFTVPADGEYYVCLSQAVPANTGGPYILSLETLSITATDEAELPGVSGTNDDAATAEVVSAGSIYGWHVDGEADYFAITLPASSILRTEITANRNGMWSGEEYLNLNLDLYDMDGTSLLAGSSNELFLDPALQYIFVTAGTYYVSVGEDGGAGDGPYLLNLSVVPYTGGSEVESNDDTATANALAYGDLVGGAIDSSEIDMFSFVGTAGDSVAVSKLDSMNSQGPTDPVTLELLDTDGTTTLSTASSSTTFQNARTILQADGTYFVRVTRPVAPPALLGGPTAYGVLLELISPAGFELEPNDAIADASPLDAGDRGAGVIYLPSAALGGTATDLDVYSFSMQKGEVATVYCYASTMGLQSSPAPSFTNLGSVLRPTLRAIDSSGTEIGNDPHIVTASSQSVGNPLASSALTFRAENGGTHYILIQSNFGATSLDRFYVLEKQ